MRSKSILVAVGVLLAFNSGAQAVTIDWVTVGNVGNAADSTGYGGVSDVYQISKYEVTAGQYCDFLNSVATTDNYGLYNTSMDSSNGCQIWRHGSSGSYTYDFSGRPSGDESDWSNRPVNYVSWYDSLRFSNWLHNGQGTGDTETGAYTITDWDGTNGTVSNRNVGAQVWLPNEDEWYKAAYHKNDGVTGNYFDYPTSSDSVPSNDLIDPDPGNNATFWQDSGYTIGSPYYRTEVGAHENSDSPYGTFDMAGNVWEWNESLVHEHYRGVRGGGYYKNDTHLISSCRRIDGAPNNETEYLGFRVASVPEPATLLLLGLGAVILRRKRQK